MAGNVVFASGGEYGDMYAAAVEVELKKTMPDAAVKCIRALSAGGLDKELSVHIPDCIVFTGQPGFDPALIKKAKQTGAAVVYYAMDINAAPDAKLLAKSAALVDRVLSVYPFEMQAYKEAGMSAEFVGHPLVDIVDFDTDRYRRDQAKIDLGYDRTEVPVTIMGGGNSDEEKRLLKMMVKAAAETAEVCMWKVKLLLPDSEKYEDSFVEELRKLSYRRFKAFKGQRHECLMASHVTLTTPGTWTLEAALTGTHMVVVQKTSILSGIFSSLKNKNKFICLPNIIMDTRLYPELTQRQATQNNIVIDLVAHLEQVPVLLVNALDDLREKLGPPGTVKRAAQAICGLAGMGG